MFLEMVPSSCHVQEYNHICIENKPCVCVFVCHFSPRTSSQFCTDSARSLVAAYNDGALPCNCDASGSTETICSAVGGQCPCRPHVIGRQCTKCATGYYGFPYCRRESIFSCNFFLKSSFSLCYSQNITCAYFWPHYMLFFFLQHVTVDADCATKWRGAASAPRRQSNQPVTCVRIRLSATTLCWAARTVHALQTASMQMQGLSVTASPVSAGEPKPTWITHPKGSRSKKNKKKWQPLCKQCWEVVWNVQIQLQIKNTINCAGY